MTDSSHHRRRHLRHQPDGTVTPVRDATVKNRGRNADAPSRNNPSSDALVGLAATDDNFNPDDVIFAFEHPEWSSKGFTRATSKAWMDHDIDPENAEVWHSAGYPPGVRHRVEGVHPFKIFAYSSH